MNTDSVKWRGITQAEYDALNCIIEQLHNKIDRMEYNLNRYVEFYEEQLRKARDYSKIF